MEILSLWQCPLLQSFFPTTQMYNRQNTPLSWCSVTLCSFTEWAEIIGKWNLNTSFTCESWCFTQTKATDDTLEKKYVDWTLIFDYHYQQRGFWAVGHVFASIAGPPLCLRDVGDLTVWRFYMFIIIGSHVGWVTVWEDQLWPFAEAI